MKKWIVWLALMALMTVTAVSVWANGGADTGSEVAELRYMMWDPQIVEKEQALADAFVAANDDVASLLVEAAPYNQYWEKMLAMTAAKNLPDVFWTDTSNSITYGELDAFKEMTSFIDTIDKGNYFPAAFDTLKSSEGKTYAFPYAVVNCIFYYNIRLFDEAGLDYPDENWTWDDVLAAAETLTQDTDGDGDTDQWGYWVKGRYAQNYGFVYNNGSQILSDDDKSAEMTTGSGKDAWDYLTGIVLAGYSPTAAQMQGVSKPFTTGQIGMVSEGSWRISSYRSALEDPFGIALIPRGPESTGDHVVYGWTDNFAMSNYTEYPDQAWKWMLDMTGPKRPYDSLLGGKVPIWREAAMSEVWLEKGQMPANKEVVLEAVDLIGSRTAPKMSEWRPSAESMFDKIVLGEVGFEAGMKELEEKINQILNRD